MSTYKAGAFVLIQGCW